MKIRVCLKYFVNDCKFNEGKPFLFWFLCKYSTFFHIFDLLVALLHYLVVSLFCLFIFGAMFAYLYILNGFVCMPSGSNTFKYWVGVQQGQSNLTGRRCLFSLDWLTLVVAVSSAYAYLFLTFSDLTFYLEDTGKVYSGCTVPPNSKDVKLGSSDQEASSSVDKNIGIVLVPCHTRKCIPTANSDGVDIYEVPGWYSLR